MKLHKKVLIGVVALLAVSGICIAQHIYRVQNSYYPMGGEVTVVEKYESRPKYYLVIEEPTGEQFTLLCSEEDYNQVNIGDVINCERHQSVMTHKGEVHKIKEIT